MTDSNETSGTPTSKAWLKYILTPQVLLGGVLVWTADKAYDYYNNNQSDAAKILAEVRGVIAPYVIPPPTTIEGADRSLAALERTRDIYKDNQSAKDLINTQFAFVYWTRGEMKAAAESERQAQAKRKREEEATRLEIEAKKALEDAEQRKKAAAEEELRKQQAAVVGARQALEQAVKALTTDQARATLAQRALDRAPK